MKSIYKSVEGKNQILEYYNNAIDSIPIKIEKINIPTIFGNTFVLACGDPVNDSLVLLHGTASNSATWFGDFAEYSKHFRVYAIDIVGEPGNSSELRPELGEKYSEWLNQIFDFLKLEKVNLVGMSLGGWISGRFAIDNSKRLNKLVLLCAPGFSKQKSSFLFWFLLFKPLGNFGLKRINKMIFHKVKVNEKYEFFMRLTGKYYKPRVMKLPIFSDDEIRKINFPLYYIVGDKDVFIDSEKTIDKIKNILPDSQIELRKDTGHVLLNTSNGILKFLLQ